jgi:transposase
MKRLGDLMLDHIEFGTSAPEIKERQSTKKRLDHAGIAADYLSGMTAKAIAGRHRTTEFSVASLLRRLKADRKYGLTPNARVKLVVPDGFVPLYEKGAKIREMADELGISAKSVSRLIGRLAAKGVIEHRNPAAVAPLQIRRDGDIKTKAACARHFDDLVAVYRSPLAVSSLAQVNFARQSAPPPFSQFARDSHGKVLI